MIEVDHVFVYYCDEVVVLFEQRVEHLAALFGFDEHRLTVFVGIGHGVSFIFQICWSILTRRNCLFLVF